MQNHHQYVVEAHTEAPVTTPAPPSDTPVLYVPKRTGEGFVPVTLRKLERGYLGPQGEFYPTMPTADPLAETYGRG
jgi:hypothetical protein